MKELGMILRISTPNETNVAQCSTATYLGEAISRVSSTEVFYINSRGEEGSIGHPGGFMWLSLSPDDEGIEGKELWQIDSDLVIADGVQVLAINGWVPIREKETARD